MKSHRIAMLGTGLIADFYTMALHGQRSRDSVSVVYSRTKERGDAFARGELSLRVLFSRLLRTPAEAERRFERPGRRRELPQAGRLGAHAPCGSRAANQLRM